MTCRAALSAFALVVGALFAGAALAITLAEHPARMELEPRLAALPSVPSSKRAAWMHVPLALLCFLDGVVA